MRMRPVPSATGNPNPAATHVLTTIVSFSSLILDRDSKAAAEEYSYNPVVTEFVASNNTIPAVWCDRVGPDKYKVIIQDENLFNLAAAILRDRQHIAIIMFALDSATVIFHEH
jgi:hypothetical protein